MLQDKNLRLSRSPARRWTDRLGTAVRTMQNGMSALPSKADMCGATSDVRFGPKADIERTPNLGCFGSSSDNKFELGPKAVDTFKLLMTLVHFVPRF